MTDYPLEWPAGWRRTPKDNKKSGKFNFYRKPLSMAQAEERVRKELARLGAAPASVIISTNVRSRARGRPVWDRAEGGPADCGAAVYWKRTEKDAQHKVIAADLYGTVEDNLAAIAATLEAMRAIERHGGAVILERAFTGFLALPAPNDWRHILGFYESTPTLADARARYRLLAAAHHPDAGGSHDRMSELTRAWNDAQRELAP